MADPEDRALGAEIRRRREARGMQQRELAERLGLAPVVYGRVELGSRPARAIELRDIARVLGVSVDDLLDSARPVTPAEQVHRAEACRDTAYGALRAYAAAVADAVAAVEGADEGVVLDTDTELMTTGDVIDHLARMPAFDGLTVPADLIPVLRAALASLADGVPMYSGQGDEP